MNCIILTMLMAALIMTMMSAAVMSFTPSRQCMHSIQTQKPLPRENTQICYKNLNEVHTNDASNATLPTSRLASREPTVRSILTVEDFEALVLEEKEKLVVIRFHAPWCRVSRS